MSAVSSVTGQITLNSAATFALASGVLTNYNIPATIAINGSTGTLSNGNGAAGLIDLAAWGNVTLAATSSTIAFNALTDPGGTSRNWTSGPGRIRLLAVQVLTTTSGYDLEVYSGASNGIAWLPPVANPLYARANGGTLLITDFNSNGSGVGNVLSSSAYNLVFNSGSNTVNFVWMALGSSVS